MKPHHAKIGDSMLELLISLRCNDTVVTGEVRPGWLWLNTKMVYPRTVTHPSTNGARRRATIR